VHDATGSYAPAFSLAAGTNVLAAVVLGAARPPARAVAEELR
jgi:hypothetical protein